MSSSFIPDRAVLHQIFIAFRFIGLFLAIIGLFILVSSAYWCWTASRTDAVIVGPIHDRAGNEKLLIRYIDAAGKDHQVQASSPAPSHTTIHGQSIPILYHQNEPDRIVFNRFLDKWFTGGFAILWGIFMWYTLGIFAKRVSPEAQSTNKPS